MSTSEEEEDEEEWGSSTYGGGPFASRKNNDGFCPSGKYMGAGIGIGPCETNEVCVSQARMLERGNGWVTGRYDPSLLLLSPSSS
jgi:hypothetical protein